MRDEQIIELYWERDQRAVTASEAHYGTYCRRIAMNILSSPEDAEECVNDTWHRAWDHIPPQRPRSLSAFFGRIVRNLSISRYRANRANKRFYGITVLLSELDDCVPSADSTSQALEDGQFSEMINDWLAHLAKNDRILFVRRYWYGEPVTALAEESGLTQNQVAQRLLRLRKKLKLALEKEAVEG